MVLMMLIMNIIIMPTARIMDMMMSALMMMSMLTKIMMLADAHNCKKNIRKRMFFSTRVFKIFFWRYM